MITNQPSLQRCNTARDRGHPLEIVPLFRRWPPSLARNLVYTAIWSSLIGLVLALLQQLSGRWSISFAHMLGYTVFTSNLVGYLIHGCLHLFERYVPRTLGWTYRLAQLMLVGLAAMIGIGFSTALLRGTSPLRMFQPGIELTVLAIFGGVTAALMITVLVAGERRMRREAESARQQEQIAAAGRLVAEARLRALQAQIEPHFLYNTLANVVGLIDSQPAKAKRMLERFIDYLRASLAASRAEHATVGSELDLAGAYLDVLGVRMESRLRWRFEFDPAARALPMPPMLLQPLVENAIMHGIEPKLDGGEIVVRARVEAEVLCVEVLDSGLGLRMAPPRPGGGVGLSNLRERLRQLFGPSAQLQLIENPSGGVTSRLLLPLSMVPPSNPMP